MPGAKGSVSVLDFRAIPDGIADFAPAIQAALDSGASHVLIPGGCFLPRNPVFAREGQSLEIPEPARSQFQMEHNSGS